MKKIALILFAALLLFSFSSCVRESPEPLVDFSAMKEGPRRVLYTEEINGYTFRVYSDDTAELSEVDEEKFTKVFTLPEFYENYPVVGVEAEVFMNTDFTSVIFTDKIVRIGDRAFQGSAVEEIVFPDSVVEIGEDMFENCLKLKKVTLGAGIRRIPTGFCFSCPVLEEVVMASGVLFIGEEAFGDCASLKKMEFPSSLETVESYAFWRTGLEEVRLPQGLKEVGISAFYQTPWLSAQEAEWVTVGDGVLLWYNGTSQDVTLPEEVKYLSDAFRGKSLSSLTLPDSLLKIAEGALEETAVESLIYNENNPILSEYFKTK